MQDLKAAQDPCSELRDFAMTVMEMTSDGRQKALSFLRKTVYDRSVVGTVELWEMWFHLWGLLETAFIEALQVSKPF